jgi:Protein of unknown function (DUF2569)
MLSFDENGVPTIRRSLPMALFGLALILQLAMLPLGIQQTLYAAVGGVDDWGDALPYDWRLTYGAVGGMQLVLFVLWTFTAFSYFKRKRSARRLVIITMISTVAVNISIAACLLSLPGNDDEYIATTISSTIRVCLVAAAWLTYFLVSKRVRETLVYPLDNQAQYRL